MRDYVSDKKTVERAFILFLLRIVTINAMSGDRTLILKVVDEEIGKVCKGKEEGKIVRRCDRLAVATMRTILDKDEIHGHKFILLIHSLTQRIIDSGYVFPQSLIDIFEPFFELESKMEVANKDWEALKNSADKSAKKFYEKLLTEGYYKL